MSSITPKVHSDILKEQAQLGKLEAELMKMVTSINQSLNALKVEELQLKSNTIQEDLKSRQGKSTEEVLPTFEDNPSEVNTQEIDLDLLIGKFEEEDDSD